MTNEMDIAVIGFRPSDFGEPQAERRGRDQAVRGKGNAVAMIPVELALHAADRFDAMFGQGAADRYLRDLGFDPETARREAVQIVLTGERSHLLKRDWRGRQEALARVRTQRELIQAKSRHMLARRRVRRLRRFLREIIEQVESGAPLRPTGLRKRFAMAVGKRRKDCDLAVSSERELLDRYAGDLVCDRLADVG
jgi:hypothetical protein